MATPPDTTPQLPAEVQPPPRRRHRGRKILLIIGGAFTGFIVLIVIIGVATSGSKPGTTVAANTSAPAASTSQSLITDPNGQQCVTPQTNGYCPGDSPSPSASPSSQVASFGASHGFSYNDGTMVSITSANPTTLSDEAAGGNPGDPAVLLSVKVTAGSAELDASDIQVSANGGPNGTQLSQVFDNDTNLPSGTLAPGESGTYTFEFDLVQTSNGSQLDVTVTPGGDYAAASFTGAVSS
jgi:hypothetical protein